MRYRRKLTVLFVACAVVAVAVIAGALWRVARAAPAGAVAGGAGLLTGLALVGLVVALAYIWLRVDLDLLTPGERLAREIDTLVHAAPGRHVDLPVAGALTPVVDGVNRLVDQLDAARREMAASVAAATAGLEDERSRLAALLRDLSEGVVLCNADHQITLYNAAAERMLGGSQALGLGRPIGGLFALDRLAPAFARYLAGAADRTVPVELTVETAAGGEATLRMAPVVEPDGTVAGYVLSFARVRGSTDEAETVLAPRPVFYDFDLLRRPVVTGALGAVPLARLPAVVFDTETTGLSPDVDEMVQIGAVRVAQGRVIEGEIYDTLVNPGRTIPPASIRFHGITDAMVFGAPSPADAVAVFHRFTGAAVLVAQNAAFDLRFLRRSERAAGVAFDMPVLDTMLLSFFLHPREGDHTLDALAVRYGVEVEGRHTALGDARVTARVFCRMIPLLAALGVTTLDQALDATRKVPAAFRNRNG